MQYPPSVRPALIMKKEGAELFITLGTRNCSYRKKTGGCRFCGLSVLDGEHPALLVSEAKKQMNDFFEKLPESERSKILKVSLIGMTDSLLNPKTVEPNALIEIAGFISKFLPNVVEASIETRADIIGKRAVETARAFFDKLSESLKLPDLAKEIAVGIETASQKIRDSANKGISDKQIEKLAAKLRQLGWNLKGYFMYNVLERDDNVGALKRAIDFMADLNQKTGITPSILILRGYAPEEYKIKGFRGFLLRNFEFIGRFQFLVRLLLPHASESQKLFMNFKDVPDKVALRELREAAVYAKQKGVKVEIDSTSEDQEAAKADLLSPAYTSALVRYNLTFNPDELHL